MPGRVVFREGLPPASSGAEIPECGVGVVGTALEMPEPLPGFVGWLAVAKPDEPRTGDAADGVERTSEGGPEIAGHAFGGSAVCREEQLVVFAAAQGVAERRSLGDRNRLDFDLGTDFRCFENVPEVGGDAVRQIHHGMHLAAFAEPLARLDFGQRIPVDRRQRRVDPPVEDVAQAGARSPETVADEDRVAGTGVAAPFELRLGTAADGRDREGDPVERSGRVAPDEGDAAAFG